MEPRFVRSTEGQGSSSPGTRIASFLAAFVVAAGTACNSSTEIQFPADGISIEAASTVAAVSPVPEASGFQMPVTITNRSMQPIYRQQCGYAVERSKRGGDEEPLQWEIVWTPACSRELPPGSTLIALAPGQSVTVNVDTRGSGLGASTAPDGDYRVRFYLSVNRLGGFALIPEALSVSTPFKAVIGGVMQ